MNLPSPIEESRVDVRHAALRAHPLGLLVTHGGAGKWKVSQNRPPADRDGVARGLETRDSDDGRDMAQQVRQPGTA